MGLLQETANGYVEVEQTEAPAPEFDHTHTLKLDRHNAALNNMITESMGDMTIMNVTRRIMSGEAVHDEEVRTIARRTGLDPHEVFDHINEMTDQYQAHVDNYVKSFEVEDPQEFYAWLRKTVKHHEFQSRLNFYAETRNPDAAFGKYLNQYLQQHRPIDENNPDATFYTSSNGTEMVRILNVGEMTVAQARKLKLI
jgi:hypothetical protein